MHTPNFDDLKTSFCTIEALKQEVEEWLINHPYAGLHERLEVRRRFDLLDHTSSLINLKIANYE